MGHHDAITLTTDQAVKGVQRWMALDLWMALGLHPDDFAEKYEEDGFADTWADLCQMVRDVDGFSRAAAIAPALSNEPRHNDQALDT